AGFRLPRRRQVLLSIGSLRDKTRLLSPARALRRMGFTIYATRRTSRFLDDNNVPNIRLYKIHERRRPSLLEYISPDRLDLIINIPAGYDRRELTDGYIIRRRAADFGIPLITNAQLAELFVKSIAVKSLEDLRVEPYDHYVRPDVGAPYVPRVRASVSRGREAPAPGRDRERTRRRSARGGRAWTGVERRSGRADQPVPA
ncbi:MAG: hypothetical protein ACE5JH_12765, partial [Acidobacteriota bacterium]